MNIILAVFVLIMFLINTFVSVLNYQNRNAKIPNSVKDIYDKKEYEKWHQYFMTKFKSGMIKKTFDVLVITIILFTDSFLAIQDMVEEFTGNDILQTLMFIGIFMLGSTIINLPFDYHDTFVIEEKFGFNKTTKITFFLDFIKGILLTIAIGGGILVGIVKLVNLYDDQLVYFVLSLWVASMVFLSLVMFLYTKVFIKIFNKLTPLDEGSLRDKINKLSEKIGFDVKSIWVMNASKRSTKVNAFFSGLGKNKDIVLYDTLVEKLSEEEILSVLAHELGHAVHRDNIKSMTRSFSSVGLLILILGLLIFNTSFSLGYTLIIWTIVLGPLNLLMGILFNWLSRIAEYKADSFATDHIDKKHMINALKILSKENFANLTPHPLYVLVGYGHPPMAQRIEAINNK